MIQPLKDYLLLQDVDNEGVSEGGLYIAPSAEAKIKRGVVAAVGAGLATSIDNYYVPSRRAETTTIEELPSGAKVFTLAVGDIPPSEVDEFIEKTKAIVNAESASVYAVGDIVLYSIYGANEVRDGGKKFYLVPNKEVMAKVTE